MINGLPALSTWLFYAGNVLCIAAYLVICALMLRREGLTGRGQLSPTLTTITVLFFLSCALLHLELAYHAYSLTPLVVARDGHGNGVDEHFTLLILSKVVLIVLFAVFTTRRARTADTVVPLSPTSGEAGALPGRREEVAGGATARDRDTRGA